MASEVQAEQQQSQRQRRRQYFAHFQVLGNWDIDWTNANGSNVRHILFAGRGRGRYIDWDNGHLLLSSALQWTGVSPIY